MAIHHVGAAATELRFEGETFELFRVLEESLQPHNGLIQSAEVISGVTLRREIQGGTRVRPTNVTAVLYVVTWGAGSSATDLIASRIDEVILLQNGPKGGFRQNEFNMGVDVNQSTQGSGAWGDPDTHSVFCNEVIASILTRNENIT